MSSEADARCLCKHLCHADSVVCWACHHDRAEGKIPETCTLCACFTCEQDRLRESGLKPNPQPETGAVACTVLEITDRGLRDAIADRKRKLPLVAYLFHHDSKRNWESTLKLEAVAQELAHQAFTVRCDAGENPGILDTHNLAVLPSIMVFRRSKLLATVRPTGLEAKELTRLLRKILGLS